MNSNVKRSAFVNGTLQSDALRAYRRLEKERAKRMRDAGFDPRTGKLLAKREAR